MVGYARRESIMSKATIFKNCSKCGVKWLGEVPCPKCSGSCRTLSQTLENVKPLQEDISPVKHLATLDLGKSN